MIEWCCCSFYQTGNMFMIVCEEGSLTFGHILHMFRWILTKLVVSL